VTDVEIERDEQPVEAQPETADEPPEDAGPRSPKGGEAAQEETPNSVAARATQGAARVERG
jgi:hypothetical protein